MAELNEILKLPEFQALPTDEQQRFLTRNFPGALPASPGEEKQQPSIWKSIKDVGKKTAIPALLGLAPMLIPGLRETRGVLTLAEALGGGLGEGLNQLLGITEPSKAQIAASAAAPALSRGLLGGIRAAGKMLPGSNIVSGEVGLGQAFAKTASMLPAEESSALYQMAAGPAQTERVVPAAIKEFIGGTSTEMGEVQKLFPGLVTPQLKKVLHVGGALAPPRTRTIGTDIGFGEAVKAPLSPVPGDITVADAHMLTRWINRHLKSEALPGDARYVLKGLKEAVWKDIDQSPLSANLRMATRAARKEFALEDLADAVRSSRGSIGGVEVVNADALYRRFLALADDKVFAGSFNKSEVDDMASFFKELAREVRPRSKIGLAIVSSTLGGATARAMGGDPIIGAAIGVSTPEVITEIVVSSPLARSILLHMTRAGEGKITTEGLSTLLQFARAAVASSPEQARDIGVEPLKEEAILQQ